MANKRSSAAQKKQRPAQEASAPVRREEKRPYTLMDCMKIGRIGNILFIVFIIICVIYYYSLARKGNYVIPFEFVAYTVELAGFVLFSTSVIWIDRLVRARGLMKVALLVYIVVEVILMLLEFEFLPWTHYYGLSLGLIIAHVLFSAAVSMTLLLLEPQNKNVQRIVAVTTIIILGGMLFGIAGYRVYASILINAFAYTFFFTAMLHDLRLEEINIDCHGDRAPVTQFSSTMFADTPTMVEIPQADKQPLTAKQKAKRLLDKLTPNEEQIILTDKTEKFEYEFGVDDDDEDEDDA